MSNSLAEDYLRWLAPQIRDEHSGRKDREYEGLLSVMFQKEFVWTDTFINDENRIGDGLDLRIEFANQKSLHRPMRIREQLGPCSFLEVLIGLSKRLSFQAGGSAPGWAWQLICNLELDKMYDPLTHRKARKVDDILDTVIWRTYNPDGLGGFFPLAWPDDDQTKKELWYQMAAYIDELHPEYDTWLRAK